jgi:hypothetical protein
MPPEEKDEPVMKVSTQDSVRKVDPGKQLNESRRIVLGMDQRSAPAAARKAAPQPPANPKPKPKT